MSVFCLSNHDEDEMVDVDEHIDVVDADGGQSIVVVYSIFSGC